MAGRLGAEWIVAYVETPAQRRLPVEAHGRVVQTLCLAEQLGAETVTLAGQKMSEELLALARARNVTRIVVGKPTRGFWRRLFLGSIVDALIRGAGDIDIYVVSRTDEEPPTTPVRPQPVRIDWLGYGWAVAGVALATAVAWLMFPFFELSNLIMVYLLGIVAVAARHGRGPSVLASVLSVAAFDFFFVPPYLTFAVADTQYLATFAVMLAVGLVIGGLTVRLRAQAEAARLRERRIAALYAMSRDLASTRGVDELLQVALRHITEVFRCEPTVLMPEAGGHLAPRVGASDFALDGNELAVARWVYDHRQPAGLGTATLPGAQALYLPLVAGRGPLGVLGVRPAERHAFDAPEQRHQLETFANQTAVAIERALLAEEAQQAQVRVETERLRSALLSSVSHDLRTPLATITGAASTILESGQRLDAGTQQELLESVREEAEHLNRLVQNLLEMTRLESGALQLRREWHPIEEVVGAALNRLSKRLAGRQVYTRVLPDLLLVPIDDVLIEQVLINLLDNALKYTPPESPISITVSATDRDVYVEVADRGPGLPPGEEKRIFDKFYRGERGAGRGAGLGLAICEAIVRAHGGRIWAQNLPEGGVAFFFSLPLTGTPPADAPADA